MIILDKARESLHKLLSTTKGKLVALFIYLAFGQQIASLIGTGLPVILFLAYAFIIYRSIDKIKNKPFYIKFISALPVYLLLMYPLSSNEYFGISQVFLVSGIAFFGFKLFQFEKGRIFQNIPTSKMRSLAMGLVEVKGNVEPIEDFTDPIFNKPCVYYNIVIMERRKKGKRTVLVPVHKNEKSQSFYLSDDTGSVFIPGELIPSLKREIGEKLLNNKVKMKIDHHFGETLIFKKKLPAPVKEYFNEHKIKNKRRQICQITVIEPADRLYALGNARSLNESESKYKSKASAAMDLSDDERFVISDKSEKELTEEAFKSSWFKPILAILIGLFLLLTPSDEIDKLTDKVIDFVNQSTLKEYIPK